MFLSSEGNRVDTGLLIQSSQHLWLIAWVQRLRLCLNEDCFQLNATGGQNLLSCFLPGNVESHFPKHASGIFNFETTILWIDLENLFTLLTVEDWHVPVFIFQAYAEEELEWLSNKDAFPAIETFVELSSIHPDLAKHQKAAPKIDYSTSSSNSNNSSNSITLLSGYDHLKVPVRARSRRRSRRRPLNADISGQQFWWQQLSNEICKEEAIKISTIGRKCLHCGAEKTPQWRAGPHGPKTLCNACGVRFKSGRLVPEYRPASSPTFRTELHSNSHRKVMEMRKQKHMGMGWRPWINAQ